MNASNATNISNAIKPDESGIDKPASEVSTMEKDFNTTSSALTTGQRAAIGFPAGVIGAAAVVACSYLLFGLGISGALLSGIT